MQKRPSLSEHLAAVVDHAEVLRVRHPAAAERVRRVDARRIGELHEAAEPAALARLP